jgi:CxxC motif-containing protein
MAESGEIQGQGCARGEEYGRSEFMNPVRTVTSTVRISGTGQPRCPVKTGRPIPKSKVLEAVRFLDGVELQAPVLTGDAVCRDILGTGVDFIATRSLHIQKSKEDSQ